MSEARRFMELCHQLPLHNRKRRFRTHGKTQSKLYQVAYLKTETY